MTMQAFKHVCAQCGQRARQTLLFIGGLIKSYCLLGLLSLHIVLIWLALFEPDALIKTIKALQVITPQQLSGIMQTALVIWSQLFALGFFFLLLLGVLPFWQSRTTNHPKKSLSDNAPNATGAPQ
ncbi:hypothetical protein TH25_23160 [Thalassospira profundimaris]|uniref:Uncharacterized protein n=1 Tax=Thalassospira profundimaris TaxID=502049 RepID=A0A367WKS1_9PROT|nr:hypothetical protein [Thalassospira profundimaris]RCK42017.1 hypothetical protein TH25_23160 [Thalassospira profundimaris]